MNPISRLKAAGYFISGASVLLLGAVSWKSAAEEPLLFVCLLAGMASSLAGMELRWRSHRREMAGSGR